MKNFFRFITVCCNSDEHEIVEQVVKNEDDTPDLVSKPLSLPQDDTTFVSEKNIPKKKPKRPVKEPKKSKNRERKSEEIKLDPITLPEPKVEPVSAPVQEKPAEKKPLKGILKKPKAFFK
jgi:hypothetical protein